MSIGTGVGRVEDRPLEEASRSSIGHSPSLPCFLKQEYSIKINQLLRATIVSRKLTGRGDEPARENPKIASLVLHATGRGLDYGEADVGSLSPRAPRQARPPDRLLQPELEIRC